MDILDKIISAESSGDLKKANKPNKTSSALGLGQFISGTWLDMIKRYQPELAKGKSDAELLELRKDPELSKEMTARYAAENETRLRRAGVPVTPGSAYLMHFAGPGGGVKLLKADPDTPVESILDGNAIQANPFLRGKTASWVIAWANKKMADAAAQPKQWGAGAGPVASLAQAQAVEPAFDATGWPPRPTSPNVLSPEGARPFSGPPSAPAIRFADEATRARQVLDSSLPAPGATPWDLSGRFGKWSSLDGISGPVQSGARGDLGQSGDGSGAGANAGRWAGAGADFTDPPGRAATSSANSGGTSLVPVVPFPLEALLGSDRNRGLDAWASPRRRGDPSLLPLEAATDLPDRTASATASNSSRSDPASVGGLLGLIQHYLGHNTR